MESLEVEIYYQGRWQSLAEIVIKEPKESSYSSTEFEYDLNYYFETAEYEGQVGFCSASVNLPLNAVRVHRKSWPGFLLDLMPQGAAREIICKRESIVNGPQNDFQILKAGAINPVGNLRIKSNHKLFAEESHEGFQQKDLEEKNENFLEHAAKFGAITVGASGTQGMAPKFLLNQDSQNHWHCDGSLKDEKVQSSWIVKFKKASSKEDELILEAEKVYMDIAIDVGLNGNKGLKYKDQVLYIPRFDRVKVSQGILRYGLESVSSALEHNQFGVSENHEKIIEVIYKVSSQPKIDILEYIRRDFLNIVMGNTDNHTRNTAFLKTSESEVRLSPLFDFAPMVMDPEMIARVCKWKEEESYIPDFSSIEEELIKYGFSEEECRLFFQDIESKWGQLPGLFQKYGLKKEVIERSTRKKEGFMKKLKAYNLRNL